MKIQCDNNLNLKLSHDFLKMRDGSVLCIYSEIEPWESATLREEVEQAWDLWFEPQGTPNEKSSPIRELNRLK